MEIYLAEWEKVGLLCKYTKKIIYEYIHAICMGEVIYEMEQVCTFGGVNIIEYNMHITKKYPSQGWLRILVFNPFPRCMESEVPKYQLIELGYYPELYGY